MFCLATFTTLTMAETGQIKEICTDSGLRLNVNGVSKWEVCSREYCTQQISEKTENYVEVLIPANIKLRSHKVTIKRAKEDGITTTDITCPAVSFCETIKCFWCTATITNPECNPTLSISMLGFTLYVIFSCCYIIAKVKMPIGGPCLLAIQISWYALVFSIILVKTISNCLKVTGQKINKWAARNWRTMREHNPILPVQAQRRRFYDVLTIIGILLVLSHITSACQEIDISTSKEKICIIKENGDLKCRIKTSELLTMSPMKREACLRISRNGTATREIRIHWINIELQCEKEVITYSRDTIQKVMSSKRCPHAGTCSGKKCDKILRTSKIEELEEVNGHLGFTGCVASCGDIACGCFFPSTGCLFYRVYAEAVSQDIYEIFRCETWQEKLNVNVTITKLASKNPKQTTTEKKLTINNQVLIGKNEMMLKSIHIPYSPILNSWFIRKNNTVAMWQENEFPTVRCLTEPEAKSMNCTFEENCKCDPSEEEMHCTCKDLNMYEKMTDLNYALPKTTPIWQIRNTIEGETMAFSDQATMAELSISVDELEDAIIIKTIDKCYIEDTYAEGCYNCEEGSKAVIKCTSRKYEVIADINCEKEQFAVPCNSTGFNSTIRFFTTSAQLRRTCSYNCGKNIQNFTITSTLKFHGSMWDATWRVISGKRKITEEFEIPDVYHLWEVYKSFMFTMFTTVFCIAVVGLSLAALTYAYGMRTTTIIALLIFKLLREILRLLKLPFVLIQRICRKIRQLRRRQPENIALLSIVFILMWINDAKAAKIT